MKKLVWLIVLILILGGAWWLTQNQSPAPAGETKIIKVGFIGPLTGDGAAYGETEKNATELALTDLAEVSGMPKFEVIYEDGKCTGKDAASAIQKLVSVNRVKIILGGICSAETLAAAPIAEQNRVLLFSAFSSNPTISEAGDYVFRNSPKDTDVAAVDASIIIAANYKTVALVSENTDYSRGVRDIMRKIFDERGVAVVADELYASPTSQATDFRSILTKVKAANPEMVYLNPGTSAQAGGVMVKQARELGITVPLHGNFSLGTPEAIESGGHFMNGVIISDSSGLTERGKSLVSRYQTMFGKKPTNEFELGAAYDRVFILAEAILKSGYDVEKIRDYLYDLPNFSGVIGDYRFDENGDVVGVGFTNFVLRDGDKIPYTTE